MVKQVREWMRSVFICCPKSLTPWIIVSNKWLAPLWWCLLFNIWSTKIQFVGQHVQKHAKNNSMQSILQNWKILAFRGDPPERGSNFGGCSAYCCFSHAFVHVDPQIESLLIKYWTTSTIIVVLAILYRLYVVASESSVSGFRLYIFCRIIVN